MADNEQVIGQIGDGDNIIRVTVVEYRGQKYIDARNFFRNDAGDYIPTKKGIRINAEFGDDLSDLIQQAIDSI